MCWRWSAGRSPHHVFHRRHVARGERRRPLLDVIEERVVLDERRLHRLRQSAAPVAIRQRRQEARIVDDGEGGREGAEIVLLAEGVDAVLDADRRIVLRQHRGRKPDQADPPVRHRRRVAHDVEHRAAADRGHVGVPVERGIVDRLQDQLRGGRVVLRLFPAGDDEHRRGQLQRAAMRGAIAPNRLAQRRMRGIDAAVDHEQDARRLRRHRARRRLQHERVRRREHVPAEVDRISEGDADFVFEKVHGQGQFPVSSCQFPWFQRSRFRRPGMASRTGSWQLALPTSPQTSAPASRPPGRSPGRPPRRPGPRTPRPGRRRAGPATARRA